MKILLISFILMLVAIGVFSQVDEELSAESQAFIKAIEIERQSKAYPYFIGLFASAESDWGAVGQKILDEQRKAENDIHYQIEEYPEPDRLPLPEGGLFCRFSEEGCLQTLFSDSSNISALLRDHVVLLERMEQLLQFDDYQTLVKPDVSELFPPYDYFSAGQRLQTLSAILAHQNGNSTEAQGILMTQVSSLRKWLAMQDSLIGKIVTAVKISDALDTASVILAQSGNTQGSILERLSKEEISFTGAATREFASLYYLFSSLDKHSQFFDEQSSTPGWWVRAIFKPNMSINSVAPVFSWLEHLSQLTLAEFALAIEKDEAPVVSSSRLRNYAGHTLASISTSYEVYLAPVMDLDAKIVLFNQLHFSGKAPLSIQNPYYKTATSHWKGNKLCFDGPLEDERDIRCLAMRLDQE